MEEQPLFTQLEVSQQFRGGGSSVWMCPEQELSGKPVYFSYGMNMWLSTWHAPAPEKLTKVGPLSTMVFMADGIGTHCSVLPSAKPYSPVARHNGSVNLSFLDGHVKSFEGEYVGCGVGIPDRPDIRWIVPGSEWEGPHD